VGGADAPALDGPLERYGRALGRAFQIADDVLDADVDEATAGKSVGHDLQEGKLTLPVLLACEADAALGKRVRAALGEKGVSAADAAEILTSVRAAGGVTRARERAHELAADAVTELEAVPPSPFRDALRDLAALSVDRRS
jgi:octaprenyl-diphosphate synthase